MRGVHSGSRWFCGLLALSLVVGCKDDGGDTEPSDSDTEVETDGGDSDTDDGGDTDTPQPELQAALFGASSRGGAQQMGALFRVELDNAALETHRAIDGTPSFGTEQGALPGGLVAHPSSGELWGLMTRGGSTNSGALVQIDPVSKTLETVYSFASEEGIEPIFAPLFVDDDTLVGLTRRGGSEGHGTLWRFTLSTGTMEVLMHFPSTGGRPNAQVQIDSQGWLWGALGGEGELLWRYNLPDAANDPGLVSYETQYLYGWYMAEQQNHMTGAHSADIGAHNPFAFDVLTGSTDDASSAIFLPGSTQLKCRYPLGNTLAKRNTTLWTLCQGEPAGYAGAVGSLVSVSGVGQTPSHLGLSHVFQDPNALKPYSLVDGNQYLYGVSTGPAVKGDPAVAPRVRPKRKADALRDMKEGLVYVREHPPVFGLIVLSIIPFLFGMPLNTLLPAFNNDVMGGGADSLGVLVSARGAGAIVGSLMMATMGDLRRKSLWLIVTCIGWGAATAVFGMNDSSWMVFTVIVVIGWVSSWNMSLNRGMLQMQVDDHMRGRIMSIDMMSHGLMPLGVFPITYIAENYGVGMALEVSGLMFIVFSPIAWVDAAHAVMQLSVGPMVPNS